MSDNKITVTLDDYVSGDDITITLDDTYGATTTYWAGDSITDVVYSDSADGTFTIDASTMDGINISDYIDRTFANNSIEPSEVERMCNEYPALEKVWRNFKSVYDMVKQDYEGKKKSGEIDDEYPF
jgi:hypothetical protein